MLVWGRDAIGWKPIPSRERSVPYDISDLLRFERPYNLPKLRVRVHLIHQEAISGRIVCSTNEIVHRGVGIDKDKLTKLDARVQKIEHGMILDAIHGAATGRGSVWRSQGAERIQSGKNNCIHRDQLQRLAGPLTTKLSAIVVREN